MIEGKEITSAVDLVKRLKLGVMFEYKNIDHQGNGIGQWHHVLWGTHLYFYLGTYGSDKGKITIGIGYPRDKFGESHSQYLGGSSNTQPSITVSGNKSPEQIATDIERRLMPEFLRLSELNAQRIASHEANLDSQVAMGKYLKTTFPWLELKDTISSNDWRGPKDGVSLWVRASQSRMPHTDIKVSHNGTSTDIKIDSLSREETCLILNAVHDIELDRMKRAIAKD